MSSLCFALASYALCSLWQLPLLAAATWAGSRFVRRLGPAVEHRLWVGSYLLSILLPATFALSPLLRALHAPFVSSALVLTDLTTSRASVSPAGSPFSIPASFAAALALAFGAVVLSRLLRLAQTLRGTLSLLRTAQPLPLTPEAAEIWAECRHLHGRSAVRLLQSQGVSGPVTISARRPAILLPPGFADRLTPEELRATLAHECAHIQRHDFAKNLCYQAAGCLIDYHPVAWLLQARLAETREMVCDAAAALSLPARSAYLHSLLRLATLVAARPPHTPPHAIGIFDANILEKRIMTLKLPSQLIGTPRRVSAVVLASACLCCAFAVAVVAAPRLTPAVRASSTAAPSDDHVYRVGGEVTAPQLIFQKEPEFPASAHDLPEHFSGSCLLGLTVDRSGTPKDVHVLRTLSRDFDASAIQSVQQYRFKPAQRLGKPVSAALSIEVNFQKF